MCNLKEMDVKNTGIAGVLVAISIIGTGICGCEDQVGPAAGNEQSSRTVKDMSHLYRITSDETLHTIKRTVEVEVERPLTEEQLEDIASEIRALKSTKFERTFIGYRLSDQTVDMYWATTHFNPSLKVNIAGMTVEQQQQVGNMPIPEDWDLIGTWLDQTPYVGSEIFIYVKDGKTYIRNAYLDGSIRDREVVESASSRGRRFDDVSGSDFDDHCIIDSKGNLQFWDEDGLISIANQQ
jgi:hypothetical protein